MRFGRVIEEASVEMDAVRKFQTDVVKLLNPKSGTYDKIFCLLITPYNEKSHKGMKITYSTMMELLQFVKADDQRRYTALPNAKKEKFTTDVMDYPVVISQLSQQISFGR